MKPSILLEWEFKLHFSNFWHPLKKIKALWKLILQTRVQLSCKTFDGLSNPKLNSPEPAVTVILFSGQADCMFNVTVQDWSISILTAHSNVCIARKKTKTKKQNRKQTWIWYPSRLCIHASQEKHYKKRIGLNTNMCAHGHRLLPYLPESKTISNVITSRCREL